MKGGISSQEKARDIILGKSKDIFQINCFPLASVKFIRFCWKVEDLGGNLGHYVIIRAVKLSVLNKVLNGSLLDFHGMNYIGY